MFAKTCNHKVHRAVGNTRPINVFIGCVVCTVITLIMYVQSGNPRVTVNPRITVIYK